MKSGLIHAAGPQSAWCPILAMGLRSSGRRGKPGGWDEGQLFEEWQWIQLTILTAEVRVGTRDEFLKRLGASHVSVDTKLDLSSAKSRVWLHSLFFTSIMDFNFLRISGINNLHLNIGLISSLSRVVPLLIWFYVVCLFLVVQTFWENYTLLSL